MSKRLNRSSFSRVILCLHPYHVKKFYKKHVIDSFIYCASYTTEDIHYMDISGLLWNIGK